MTENSFPFESVAEPPPFEDGDEGGSRKSVLLVGGVVASLVLGAGGFFLLNSGGGEDDEFAVPARAPQAAAPMEAEPAPVEVIPVATTEQVGRSPFKVLYVEPKAAPAGTTTEGTPTGTATGATSGTVDSGSGDSGGLVPGSGGAGSKPGSGGAGETVPEQPKTPPKHLTVVAVDAAANQVTFKLVDRAAEKPEDVEQSVVVKPGEIFATYFKLIGYGTMLDANDKPRNCTDLQYGDALLKLCERESYQVG
jgi:hypothetical protein